jgi:hypothetical protein
MKAAMSKLGKMQMPAKKKPEDQWSMMELEEPAPDAESDSEDAGEMTGESEGETGREPSPEGEAPSLDAASDDELMAELRKRGLSGRAEKAASKSSPDEEY